MLRLEGRLFYGFPKKIKKFLGANPPHQVFLNHFPLFHFIVHTIWNSCVFFSDSPTSSIAAAPLNSSSATLQFSSFSEFSSLLSPTNHTGSRSTTHRQYHDIRGARNNSTNNSTNNSDYPKTTGLYSRVAWIAQIGPRRGAARRGEHGAPRTPRGTAEFRVPKLRIFKKNVNFQGLF